VHCELIAVIVCAKRFLLDDLILQVGDEQQNAKPAGGTIGRSSTAGAAVNSQNDDVMSDLARRLQERRAKTDQVIVFYDLV